MRFRDVFEQTVVAGAISILRRAACGPTDEMPLAAVPRRSESLTRNPSPMDGGCSSSNASSEPRDLNALPQRSRGACGAAFQRWAGKETRRISPDSSASTSCCLAERDQHGRSSPMLRSSACVEGHRPVDALSRCAATNVADRADETPRKLLFAVCRSRALRRCYATWCA